MTRLSIFLSLLLLFGGTARAQTVQFLPEGDVYSKINSNIRLQFQVKETREAGFPTQIEIGPSIEFVTPPLLRLRKITVFDLDDVKARPLQLSIGYRYVPSPNKPALQRLELVATPHIPLFAKILLTDRNRADLDWSTAAFAWRYRNRATFERRVSIRSYHPAPYASAEVFYQSKSQKWSTTALYAGCLFPVGKHFEFDPYYVHQNVTGKPPNQQFNQLGLVLNVFIQTLKVGKK